MWIFGEKRISWLAESLCAGCAIAVDDIGSVRRHKFFQGDVFSYDHDLRGESVTNGPARDTGQPLDSTVVGNAASLADAGCPGKPVYGAARRKVG